MKQPIIGYAAGSTEFPHESTVDQWFAHICIATAHVRHATAPRPPSCERRIYHAAAARGAFAVSAGTAALTWRYAVQPAEGADCQCPLRKEPDDKRAHRLRHTPSRVSCEEP